MPLEARQHVRKMRGGAQSHLIQADDGQCYVVKFQNNPQHRRILVNELIASVFLRYLQISAPEIAIINISEEFLRANAQVCLELGTRRVAVRPGWHFGSRYPAQPEQIAIYDFLPDGFLQQVTNLYEFAGALAFDKWMANANGRQAVFFRAHVAGSPAGTTQEEAAGRFIALMIDQGFVLNGPHWDFPDSPLQGLYHRPLVYQPIKGWDDFQPWLEQILHFPEEVMDEAYKRVPREWLEGEEEDLEAVLEQLVHRRRRVPDLISDCRRAKPSLFPNWG